MSTTLEERLALLKEETEKDTVLLQDLVAQVNALDARIRTSKQIIAGLEILSAPPAPTPAPTPAPAAPEPTPSSTSKPPV